MLPSGNLIVYGAIVDTVENVFPYFPAGEFAKFAGAPKGSLLRFVHVRVNVSRVLRGRTSDREVTFGLPIEFIPAPDSLRAAGDSARIETPDRAGTAQLLARFAPGRSAVFPLLLEPLAPGGWMLANAELIIPEENGRLAGETVPAFSMAARAFYGRRDLAALALAADAVVMARVSAAHPACESRRDTVFTCVGLSIDRWFKAETDTALTLLVPDPIATSWRVPIVRQDIPKLRAGEEQVIFLKLGADGSWRLLEGRSGVVPSRLNWVTECPRDGGPVYGINMDADSFHIWLNHMLDRAAEEKQGQY
jgi:hypothetical protein